MQAHCRPDMDAWPQAPAAAVWAPRAPLHTAW